MLKLTLTEITANRLIKTTAVTIAAASLLLACATQGATFQQWAAHGYLSPSQNGDPDIIGVFDNLDDCREAADGWASRQVVGNPVHAECYPVDPN